MFSIVPFILLLFQGWTVSGGKAKIEDWANHESLGKEGRYNFYWTVDKDIIRIKLEVAGAEWVGFGLSQDGSLANSDVVIGGVTNKEKYLYDYHGDKKGRLSLDKQQDWKLLSASVNKSFVVLQFSRKLDTCDLEDWPITIDTQRILYATSKEKFISPDGVPTHKLVWRSVSLKLLQARISIGPMPKGLRHWDLLAGNFTIPGNLDTLYYCKIYRPPPMEGKHHIIKISPIIPKESRPFVHHFSLRKCNIISVEAAEEAIRYGGVNCFQENIPPQLYRCENLISAWGVNGGSLLYPQHIGQPFGVDPVEYYMIQIHYDNANLVNGVMDNSGIRVYFTPHLRKFDAHYSVFGMISQDYIVIPPKQKEFLLAGHASPQCLRQTIPKSGIHISSIFLHTHLLGRKLRLRHFRGNKELPPVAIDMNYDFNNQDYTYLSKEVTVLPTDHVTLECTYESSERNVTTFGGRSTREEMCMAFVLYRSETDLTRAISGPSLETIAGLTGMDLSTGIYNLTGVLGREGVNYRNYLLHYDWTKSHICSVQNAMRFSPHEIFCSNTLNEQYKIPRISYPENLKPYIEPDQCNMGKKDPKRNRNISTCKNY